MKDGFSRSVVIRRGNKFESSLRYLYRPERGRERYLDIYKSSIPRLIAVYRENSHK